MRSRARESAPMVPSHVPLLPPRPPAGPWLNRQGHFIVTVCAFGLHAHELQVEAPVIEQEVTDPHEWWRWVGTNSATNNPEMSVF